MAEYNGLFCVAVVAGLLMKLDPFVVAILLLAALPTAAISLKSATGWRAGVVFAAFYPALVVVVGIVMIATFISLAAAGIVDLD